MIDKFIKLILLLLEFTIGGALIYFSAMWTFPTCIINLMLFVPGIFVWGMAHDNLLKWLDKK